MLNALRQMVVLYITDSPKKCKAALVVCLMQLLPNDEITLLCKLNVQSDFFGFCSVFFLPAPKLFVSSVLEFIFNCHKNLKAAFYYNFVGIMVVVCRPIFSKVTTEWNLVKN